MTTILVESMDFSGFGCNHHKEETACGYSDDGIWTCETSIADSQDDSEDVHADVEDIVKARMMIAEDLFGMTMLPQLSSFRLMTPFLSLINNYNYQEDSMDTDVEGEQFQNFLDVTELDKNERTLTLEVNKNTAGRNTEEVGQELWEDYSVDPYSAAAIVSLMFMIFLLVTRFRQRRYRAFSRDKRRPLLVVERAATQPKSTVSVVQMPDKTLEKESSLVFI